MSDRPPTTPPDLPGVFARSERWNLGGRLFLAVWVYQIARLAFDVDISPTVRAVLLAGFVVLLLWWGTRRNANQQVGVAPRPANTITISSRIPPLGVAAMVAGVLALLIGQPALVIGIGAMLAASQITGRRAVRRLEIGAATRTDARVGDATPCTVTLANVGSPVEVRTLGPASPFATVDHDMAGGLDHRAERRGVFPAIEIEAVHRGWFGLVETRRRELVLLDQPIFVAPQPVDEPPPPDPETLVASDHPVHYAAVASGDLVRTLRPYRPGDSRRAVHWPATARRGELVVREWEAPAHSHHRIEVVLAGDEREDERICGRASTVAAAVLRRGDDLTLTTPETEEVVTAPVRSALELDRRLARAAPVRQPWGTADSPVASPSLSPERPAPPGRDRVWIIGPNGRRGWSPC